jgi:hypothetical protein
MRCHARLFLHPSWTCCVHCMHQLISASLRRLLCSDKQSEPEHLTTVIVVALSFLTATSLLTQSGANAPTHPCTDHSSTV